MPSVAVSIVVYRNEPELVRWALDGLREQTLMPERVLLHANASSAEDAGLFNALGAGLPLTVSWSEENLGFSGGHNTLAARAFSSGADLVVVHNPDLHLAPTALAVLAGAGAEVMGLLGPVLELADPETRAPSGRLDTTGIVWVTGGRHLDRDQGAPLAAAPGATERVAGVSGACLAVTRAAYDAILAASGELFDEDFFAYREDAELAFRAGLLGVPSHVVPAARGLHVRNLRGTTRGASAAIDRLGVRNRFLLAFKYGSQRPGGRLSPLLRDLLVLTAVVVRERSSWSGITEAWRLRRAMRRKGARVLAAAVMSSRDATRF